MVFGNLLSLFLLFSSYPILSLPDGHKLRIELALTPTDRAYGLMFRESLPEDMGMLFVFPQCDGEGFWMKNCRFPLDIIFIDKNQKIYYIQHNAPPCHKEPCPVYTPPKPACYVLEINGKASKKFGLKKGVILPIKELLHGYNIP